MFYLGLALCVLVSGISLLTGDGVLLRVSYDFGEQKNTVGVVCIFLSLALFGVGIKSLRNS